MTAFWRFSFQVSKNTSSNNLVNGLTNSSLWLYKLLYLGFFDKISSSKFIKNYMKPSLSSHFTALQPSAIRLAQIKFLQRKDKVKAINLAIGNVSLPMHPKMIKRMKNLCSKNSPFNKGVVPYSATQGFSETNQAFLNIIAGSGFSVKNLYSQITDGASQAMELVILGVCGPAGSLQKPLLLIDPAYTNYQMMAKRLGRSTITISRTLKADGKFTNPSLQKIEKIIKKYQPGALIVIPYDNPTGQLFTDEIIISLGKFCVKHNLWLISDEAYRELHYTKAKAVSIWGLTEKIVPGITGRRISLESASKVWNACGLRIGAIITDNQEFNKKAIAENTANLCPNVIGQYIFGALANINRPQLKLWFSQQRLYYSKMMKEFTGEIKRLMPKIIISEPQASIYSVIDVRNMVAKNFNCQDFAIYCATKGKIKLNSQSTTLLVSPMAEFYNPKSNSGRFQMRLAYVQSPEIMRKVPLLFKKLLEQFLTPSVSYRHNTGC